MNSVFAVSSEEPTVCIPRHHWPEPEPWPRRKLRGLHSVILSVGEDFSGSKGGAAPALLPKRSFAKISFPPSGSLEHPRDERFA